MTQVTLIVPKSVRNLVKGPSKNDRRRALSKTLLKASADLEGYPPATAANRAPAPFYIRGRGTQLANGQNTNSSERLSVKWSQSVSINGEEGTLENRASYAPFVIGNRQAKFHAMRGWPSVPKYAKDRQETQKLGAIWAAELLKDVV